MKFAEIHRIVVRNGWTVLRQSGSHVIYQKDGITYPVPYHGGKEMGKGLERKIFKDMDLL